MESQSEQMTRKEFISRIVEEALPIILTIVAIWVGFSIYKAATSPGNIYQLLLLLVLIAVFAYPALKRRYGQKIWEGLPHSVRQIALGIKIVLLILGIVFFLLLGLSMPILLVLACIQLIIENYRLKKQTETKTAD